MIRIPFLTFSNLHAPIKAEMLAAFEEVYDSYWYVLGKSVSDFEAAYAAFSDTKYCVGVGNGLDAIYLSLKALGVGEGDEVIVPSNTYIATLLAVTYTGAKPVLVEPDPITYNIDPARIAEGITRKTKAIIPVHLYGQCCDMRSIMAVAREHGVGVVEDNAQAHGSTFAGKIAGSWGDVNATSFYPGKNLGALGDAGAVTTNDEGLAKAVAILRNYGSAKKYYNEVIGHNMRLDELQARLLTVKLKYLNKWTLQRQEIASWYLQEMKGIEGVILPYTHPDASHSYHLFVIRYNKRDQLQQFLMEKGIGTMIHYPVPPHLQQAYLHLGFKAGDFPLAEQFAQTCLSLPLWPGMTKEIVEEVCDAVRKFSDQ